MRRLAWALCFVTVLQNTRAHVAFACLLPLEATRPHIAALNSDCTPVMFMTTVHSAHSTPHTVTVSLDEALAKMDAAKLKGLRPFFKQVRWAAASAAGTPSVLHRLRLRV